MELIQALAGEWWPVVAAVIAVASTVAAITGTPDPDTALGKLYKYVIEWPALNIGKAKD